MARRERRRAKGRGTGAAAAGPDPVDVMLRTAFDHHRAGRAAAAAALYERVLQQRPSHADALHLYGVLHAQTGRLEAALPLLTKAVRRAPRNAGFLSDLGNALNGLGHRDEAIAHYRRAAALDQGVGAGRRAVNDLDDAAQADSGRCGRRMEALDRAGGAVLRCRRHLGAGQAPAPLVGDHHIGERAADVHGDAVSARRIGGIHLRPAAHSLTAYSPGSHRTIGGKKIISSMTMESQPRKGRADL